MHSGKETREFIRSLKVGDLAPNCFGQMKKVTNIFASGIDRHGKEFICFYAEFSTAAKMSMTLTEH
jgi:hypothetical protein